MTPDNQGLVSLIIGLLVIPLLVDLATKKLADARVKATVLFALSLIQGIVNELFNAMANNVSYDIRAAAYAAATSLVFAVAGFFGLLKPLGVAGTSGAIQNKFPGGIGTASRETAAKVAIEETVEDAALQNKQVVVTDTPAPPLIVRED